MRITENFPDPLNDREMQQVSVHTITSGPEPNRVELHFSLMTPRFRLQDLDILIDMLQAIKQRADRHG